MKVRALIIAGVMLTGSLPGWALSLTDVSASIVTPNGDGFNDQVRITVANPSAADLQARLYDVSGREVASLGLTSVGENATVTWDGRGYSGAPVESGVYIYQITGASSRLAGMVAVAR